MGCPHSPAAVRRAIVGVSTELVSSSRSRIDRKSPPASAAGLAAGRAALDRGDWEAALHAFESLPASEAEQPEALEGLGLAAWWLDLGDTVFDVRERAY